MRVVDFLRHVRDGKELDGSTLRQFIAAIGRGEVTDYHAAAFLMAVFCKGLATNSIVEMTLAMRDSGRVIDLSALIGPKVDKHSTGGVGDKISIPLAPMVAACGVYVPMISGRGLGHTGGTLDKLEAIPGFRVDLSVERFCELVERLGFALIGQTADLAPADKKLYALRDVTATVESIPLITSSILSKKLAEGIGGLVLDVKVGRGAFMKDETAARQLAEMLVQVGKGAGLDVVALLTDMNQPLGTTIGNALEIRESLDILKGCGPADTTELTYLLGIEMLRLGKVTDDPTVARQSLQKAVASGKALEKFAAVIEAQGGNRQICENPDLLPRASTQQIIAAPRHAVVGAIDPYGLGQFAMQLGAGRATAEDRVDPAAGIVLHKKVGDIVKKGEPLLTLHCNGALPFESTAVLDCYTFSENPPTPKNLLLGRLTSF